jgi:hypothetical protein
MDLHIQVSSPKRMPRVNYSFTRLPEFNFAKATPEECNVIRSKLSKSDWARPDEISGKSLNLMILRNLETAVVKSLTPASEASPVTTSQGSVFKRRNRVPREIRVLLRRRFQASKRLRAVRNITFCQASGQSSQKLMLPSRTTL